MNRAAPMDGRFTEFTRLADAGDHIGMVNAGSRSAIEAGLACATTRTDHQPDEGWVDIGLHYRLGGTLTAEPLNVEAYCASTAIDLSEGVQGCAYGYEIATPPEHGTLSGTPRRRRCREGVGSHF